MMRTNEKPDMVVMNRKKTKAIEHKPNTRKTTGKIEKGQMLHRVSSLKDMWSLLIMMSDEVISFAEPLT